MSQILKRAGAVVTVLTITAGTYSVISNVSTSSSTVKISFANVKAIRVDGGAATLNITGSDTGSDSTAVTGTRVETHGLRGLKISEQVSDDGTLVIKTRCPVWFATFRCNVKYTLVVPRSITIKGSVDGGSTSITGIDGPIDLSADAGSIRAAKVGGSLKLRSSAGSITVTQATSTNIKAESSAGSVRLEFDKDPEGIDADSSAGSVTVVVPRSNSTYAVDADTSAGSENITVKTDIESKRKVKLRSSAGNVTMRYTP